MNDTYILLAYAKNELAKETDENSKKSYEMKYFIHCLEHGV